MFTILLTSCCIVWFVLIVNKYTILLTGCKVSTTAWPDPICQGDVVVVVIVIVVIFIVIVIVIVVAIVIVIVWFVVVIANQSIIILTGRKVPPAARPDPVRQGDVQEDGRRQVSGHPLRGSPGDRDNYFYY